MIEKFKCTKTSENRGLTLDKIYEGEFSECGTAFLFINDNGDKDFWTINDYSAFMKRQ